MKPPFTAEQFFGIFEKYNTAVFPSQIVIFLLGIISIVLLHSPVAMKNKLIGSILGLLWIWTGAVYHIAFFSGITGAAFVFGLMFILQGILILIYTYKERINFSFSPDARHYTGYFFIIFGLIIYPIIAYYAEGSVTRIISSGLPCPTAILTFGFFIVTLGKFPRILLIIPSLWAILGLSAALNFGVYQDLMILVSAIIAHIFLHEKKRERAFAG